MSELRDIMREKAGVILAEMRKAKPVGFAPAKRKRREVHQTEILAAALEHVFEKAWEAGFENRLPDDD